MQYLLERVFKRILRESYEQNMDSLALFVNDANSYIEGTIYSPEQINIALSEIDNHIQNRHLYDRYELEQLIAQSARNAIKGYVQICPLGRKFSNTHGAWQIAKVASYKSRSGIGTLLHQVGAALSPNDLIVTDRSSLSPAGSGVFKTWVEKHPRQQISLPPRDITNPITTNRELDLSQRKKWPDPNKNPPHINFAYAPTQEDLNVLQTLTQNHFNFETQNSSRIEELLKNYGLDFFEEIMIKSRENT